MTAPYSLNGLHVFRTHRPPDDWLRQLNPQVLVIVGSYEHPKAIDETRAVAAHYGALLPDCLIKVRWWPDDNILRTVTPEGFAQLFFKLHVPGTVLGVGNEDAADSDAGFAETVQAWEAVTRLATAARIPIAIGSSSMGNPQYGRYEWMVPLWRLMQQARAAGVYHVYTPNTYFPPSPTASDLYDLAERHEREMLRVCKTAGVEPPPMLHGEYNLVRDAQSPLDGPFAFGASPGGWMVDLNKPTLVAPRALYVYGAGLYDTRWQWFDLSGESAEKDAFRKALVTFSPYSNHPFFEDWRRRTVVQVNEPSNPGVGVPVQALVGVNFRTNAGLSAPMQGAIAYGAKATLYPATLTTVDGIPWVFARDAAGKPGWVARRLKAGSTPYFASIDKTTPPPPFQLPARWTYVISSRMNAPRTYKGKPALHEGIDLAPTFATPEDDGLVRVMYDGVIEQIGFDADGYGSFVKVRHEWQEHVYVTWYAHLSSVGIALKVGQRVATGEPLGVVGSTGNSTGVHLHLTVQHLANGLAGYVVADVIDPERVISFSATPQPVPTPAPAPTPPQVGIVIVFNNQADMPLWESFFADTLTRFGVNASVTPLAGG